MVRAPGEGLVDEKPGGVVFALVEGVPSLGEQTFDLGLGGREGFLRLLDEMSRFGVGRFDEEDP